MGTTGRNRRGDDGESSQGRANRAPEHGRFGGVRAGWILVLELAKVALLCIVGANDRDMIPRKPGRQEILDSPRGIADTAEYARFERGTLQIRVGHDFAAFGNSEV